jgi:DNA repair exonuclease SbcCD nuclease subunit|tara:strand:+ start:273 stop:1358 length:1086 start_codon:yes stop_codon:yes gene_type:complete
MKLALVTDLHFGARNDNMKVAQFQQKFWNDVFFPYIDKHNISTVVNLGDTFDRRKFISYTSLKSAKEMLFEPLAKRNIPMHCIVGNHDITYKNTLEVNSINLLLDGYTNITEYSSTQEVEFDGTKILFVPWICKDNEEHSWQMINETQAQVCFGHLELTGFEMYKGMPNYEGQNPRAFEKFDQVFSGHFHHRSSTGSITYLGTAYEMTWSCYDDAKGFHIYDTDTRELTFIPNPYILFYKLWYDDTTNNISFPAGMTYEDIESLGIGLFTDAYVKVVIKEKTNPVLFDVMITAIENAGPIHLQVVDDHLHLDLEDDNDIIDEAEDTITILDSYIDSLDIKTNKNDLRTLMHHLYNEALAVE